MRVAHPLIASVVVFVASFCTLVLELIAGRILAPWLGVSLYTWTSIIGVCLAGIAAGNYVGGKIADRFPTALTVGVQFVVSGVLALAILPATVWVIDAQLGREWPLMLRILVDTTIVFFLPTAVLGTISPVVIKLSLADLGRTGSIVGRIYAISTVGAIAGTFATGFFLIDVMGTRAIVWWVAAALIAIGVVVARPWRKPALLTVAALAIGVLALAWYRLPAFAAPCLRESNYYCIQIVDDYGMKALKLDQFVHSYVSTSDPTIIGYGYERTYQELTDFHVRGRASFTTLAIGAGGYTFPRYLIAAYPHAKVDVLEIDPAVIEVARQYLGVPDDPRLTSYSGDARLWFIEERPVGRYDIVYGDAFNDIAIPWHLTTLEFDRMIRRSLAPDGLLMANIVDDFDRGDFLRASVNTLRQVFEYVYVFPREPQSATSHPTTFVLVASAAPLDLDEFQKFDGPHTDLLKFSSAIAADDLLRYLEGGRRIVLTDDHAPADNLIAPVVNIRAAP
ncbi:MAG TPA: fused MFS/spermidine synthase [Candidatus Limnocylindria bacterium]|nr:fused MFS/spermidine synthase [Candidatus Limnocylindria bacterium]